MASPGRFHAIIAACIAFSGVSPAGAQSVTIGGVTYTNRGLVGAGRVDAGKKDKVGETFGSLSGLALDLRTWRKSSNSTYTATLYTQPDRGYTKSGVTTNYRPRRHKFTLSFNPDSNGSSNQDQVDLSLTETTLLTEAGGTPLTSLDPIVTVPGFATRTGFPRLPVAFNGRLALDAEGLALLPDGTFFVSDEYGPYLYRFAADGTLVGAIRPPDALIPRRNAQESFSSDSPAAGQPSPSPSQPLAGRGNNQGLEGLSVSANGRALYALMQSATRQDGGAGSNDQRRYTRLLEYDITNPDAATLTHEWILQLPLYTQNGTQQVATVGDLVALSDRRFLVLVRDGSGRGADTTHSDYRAVLVYDTTNATNIAGGTFDNINNAAAPNGVLAGAITPAAGVVLIDINDNAQLSKFGLNNNANGNSDTLAEKWESLALAPALDPTAPDDYFLFVGNDNDFSSTDGVQLEGGSYHAGLNIDTMVLAYRVTLPGIVTLPAIATQPASQSVTAGAGVTFTTAASGTPTFQWQRNGTAITGATSASVTVANVQPGDAGIYVAQATSSAGTTASQGAILGVTSTAKLVGSGTEFPDITASNGNVYDQILLGGAAAAVRADPAQILRMSFVDLSNDIVQVEFSGAGTLTLALDGATGPAPPQNYNQAVNYMKGQAGIILTGADITTNLSIFSVGRANAANQSLFKDTVTYDGFADVAFVAITSTDGKFGGLRAANASFFATRGFTGVYAPNVQFTGPIFVGDINASDSATPVLIIGSGSDVRVTGGDLLQANNRAVQVSGITQLKFTAGSDSHGTPLAAQANGARLEQNGSDVTAQIVVNP